MVEAKVFFVCVFFFCLFVLVVVFFLNIERCSRFSQGLKFSLKKNQEGTV